MERMKIPQDAEMIVSTSSKGDQSKQSFQSRCFQK